MDMIKTIEKMVKALEHFEAYPSEREMRDQAVQAGQKLIEELSKQEGEPVAWLITDENINSLQINSIQKLIDRARHAHHTDICLRINGQDEMYEADWLKHMVKATPQQRTWVGLNWDDLPEIYVGDTAFLHGAKWAEAKLKEKA